MDYALCTIGAWGGDNGLSLELLIPIKTFCFLWCLVSNYILLNAPFAHIGCFGSRFGAFFIFMPAMTACVGYSHIGISHKGVLSANAMKKVLAEICIPVKGVVNRCVCLSLLPK